MPNQVFSVCFKLIVGAFVVLCCVRCTPDPNAGYKFLCEEGRDAWRLCKDNRVRYCHATSDPHFHTGQDCEKLGLTCVEVGEKEAACVDPAKKCSAGEARCDANTAYNCVDGSTSIAPCGTAKLCKVEGGKALCEPKQEPCDGHGEEHEGKCECDPGYKVDPNDVRSCVKE